MADWLAGTTETQWHRAGTNVKLRWKTAADCFLLLKHYSWVGAESWWRPKINRKASAGECYCTSVLWPASDAMESLTSICHVNYKRSRVEMFLVWYPVCVSLFLLPEGMGSRQVQWAEYQLDSENTALWMPPVNALWNSSTLPRKLVQRIIKHLWSAITDWLDGACRVAAVQVPTELNLKLTRRLSCFVFFNLQYFVDSN